MTSFLQRPERPTQAERQILGHSKADNHVRFLCAVSMLRHCGEGHANEAFIVEKLCEEINVERLDALVEDHEPVVAVFDLTHGARHQFSLRRAA